MNFTEYAEKYDLKALKAYMDKPGTEEFREENGVFQLPSRKAGVIPNVIVVRQDWLDQLGLKKPTTMDEFKSMLKAFKDNKMGDQHSPFNVCTWLERIYGLIYWLYQSEQLGESRRQMDVWTRYAAI